MWFKEKKEHAALLDPVAQIRPFLQKHYENLGRTVANTEYDMLHYRYVMTLKQVSSDAKLPEKPTSLRLLESDAMGPIAIHEVSLNKKKPALLETFFSQTYLKNFQNAVKKMKIKESDETKGEIRHLCIPALNVDTLWLHYGGSDVDGFVSIWDQDTKDKEIYTEDKFLLLMGDLKYRLGKMKGEMGA